jgi:hypothetical protein
LAFYRTPEECNVYSSEILRFASSLQRSDMFLD